MAINLQKGQRVSLEDSMKLAGISIDMTVVQILTSILRFSC